MMVLEMIFIGTLGLIFGSFFNVLIYRLPRKLSIIKPGSQCVHCNQSIPFYDNIPVLSYLFLRGRCRFCHVKISWRYPLVESLTALCLILLFLKYGWSAQTFVYSLLILFLIPISFIDVDNGLILNRLTVPGFILGLTVTLGLQFEIWHKFVLGALFGGFLVLSIGYLGKLIFRKESMGMGDVKLLVMIGIYVGFPYVGICLFYGILSASIFIIFGMILKKIRLGDTIPFGPFIAIGTLAHLLLGDIFINWYISLYN